MSGLLPEQAKAEAACVATTRAPDLAVIAPARDEVAPLGIYVHVPFCASTCDFCAFYQKTPDANDVARYFSGIERELTLIDWSRRVSTVYWGGGTPGMLAPRHLAQLGGLVRARCRGEPEEWTVELAPGSVTDERLAVLKDLGV